MAPNVSFLSSADGADISSMLATPHPVVGDDEEIVRTWVVQMFHDHYNLNRSAPAIGIAPFKFSGRLRSTPTGKYTPPVGEASFYGVIPFKYMSVPREFETDDPEMTSMVSDFVAIDGCFIDLCSRNLPKQSSRPGEAPSLYAQGYISLGIPKDCMVQIVAHIEETIKAAGYPRGSIDWPKAVPHNNFVTGIAKLSKGSRDTFTAISVGQDDEGNDVITTGDAYELLSSYTPKPPNGPGIKKTLQGTLALSFGVVAKCNETYMMKGGPGQGTTYSLSVYYRTSRILSEYAGSMMPASLDGYCPVLSFLVQRTAILMLTGGLNAIVHIPIILQSALSLHVS
jgi:hypothetical protein